MRFVAVAMVAITTMVYHVAMADEAAENPWQGEWISSDPHSPYQGVTIKNCTADGRCDVDTFDDSSCFRHGHSSGPFDREKLTATIYPFGMREAQCNVFITRDGENINISRVPNGCAMGTCAPVKQGENRTYHLKSKTVYTVDSSDNFVLSENCHDKGYPSKALALLCIDKDLQSFWDQAKQIPFVNLNYYWSVDRALLAKCDAVDDIKECMKEGYQSKLGELKAESARMAPLYGESGNLSEAKQLNRALSGVFKRRHRFPPESRDAPQYEDILEFVPVSDFAAYVKIALRGEPRDSCSVAGIAEYKKIGGFVYQDNDKPNACLLTIKLAGGTIEFSDPNGSCLKLCGMHTSIEQAHVFNLGQKRTIRYMPIILKSKEYNDAMLQYQERHKGNK